MVNDNKQEEEKYSLKTFSYSFKKDLKSSNWIKVELIFQRGFYK